MMGRHDTPGAEVHHDSPKGFDDFELRLGDVMRGERATLGKSLLDVQRELRIKASFIAAIENADASAFETPGFVAGYVRSYSRYLGLDPEWAFETFCREANFVSASTVDKLSSPPKSNKPVYRKPPAGTAAKADPLASPRVSFAPKPVSRFSGIEPRAIGSTMVLLALVAAVGYGGWSVLQEIQRVQVTPVERAPATVATVDPLADIARPEADDAFEIVGTAPVEPDSLERLYRPQTLEVPVMEARDGPIAALDPTAVGTLAGYSARPREATAAPALPAMPAAAFGPQQTAGADPIARAVDEAVAQSLPEEAPGPRVTEAMPEVVLVAVRPAWVRVKAADGSVLLEKILNAGDSYVVPQTEAPPILRTGAAGAVFFAVNGQTYGPAGRNGQVVDGIALNPAALTDSFSVAEATAGSDGEKAMALAAAVLQPASSASAPETAPAE